LVYNWNGICPFIYICKIDRQFYLGLYGMLILIGKIREKMKMEERIKMAIELFLCLIYQGFLDDALPEIAEMQLANCKPRK
jgi:hypothetical protein